VAFEEARLRLNMRIPKHEEVFRKLQAIPKGKRSAVVIDILADHFQQNSDNLPDTAKTLSSITADQPIQIIEKKQPMIF
jgi:ribosomal protein L5